MCSEYLLAPSLLLFRTPFQAAQAGGGCAVQIGLRILVLEFWRHLEATGFPFFPPNLSCSPKPAPSLFPIPPLQPPLHALGQKLVESRVPAFTWSGKTYLELSQKHKNIFRCYLN